MRSFIPALAILLLLGGCKKVIDQQKENLILQAMTSGEWKVTLFTDNGADITATFSGYSFKYHPDRTVTASRDGSASTGTWQEDVGKMEIRADFTGATDPLPLITGTWHIDESDWTYVLASQPTAATGKVMRLEKR